jgi:hypothetical protein
MSNNTLTVTEVVNSVTVTPVNNTVEITTGISAGSTTTAGILQLTDSVSSISTTTAATANAVKSAYDLADTKMLKYSLPWQFTYRSTYWYESRNGGTLTTSNYVQNRLYCYPLFIQETITIDRLSVEVTTLQASTTWRIGIYTPDSNGVPSTLLLDAGTVDSSSGGLKTITVSQTLTAGLYYIAGVWQGGSTSPGLRAYGNTSGNWAPVVSTNQQTNIILTAYFVDSVSGALANITSTTLIANANARTQFRIA